MTCQLRVKLQAACLSFVMGEPGCTRVYHEDLRWHIVWQRLANGRIVKETAKCLCVAESTVWRIVDRFDRVASNQATPRAHRLHEHDELVLVELVCESPSIFLRGSEGIARNHWNRCKCCHHI